MKKLITLLLACILIISLLAACGSGSASNASAAENTNSVASASQASSADAEPEFKTMGDVFALPSENYGSSDTYYVYVFEKDGNTYRAIIEFPEDVKESVQALDVFDEQYDAKIRELVAPLEITKLENLNDMIPSQEELDALVGKTGQELLDDNWTIWSWQTDGTDFGMNHGPFSFIVTFDGPAQGENEIGDPEIGPLTVTSVAYDGIGDATNID